MDCRNDQTHTGITLIAGCSLLNFSKISLDYMAFWCFISYVKCYLIQEKRKMATNSKSAIYTKGYTDLEHLDEYNIDVIGCSSA